MCFEIKVFNLSVEAQNLIGSASAYLDLDPAEGLRLSKDIEKMSRINQISTEGVLGFSVEDTKQNKAIFAEFDNPLVLDNPVEFYSVSASIGGHQIRLNRLYVKGYRNGKFDLELRRAPDHWIELASEVKVNEINFGTVEFVKAMILSSWTKPAYKGDFTVPATYAATYLPYYFPLVDFGGWVDQTPVPQGAEGGRYKSVGVEDFRPLVSLPYLLKNGFCAFNWTLQGVIFDTDWMQRLWLYLLKPDYYTAGRRGGRIVGRRFVRKAWYLGTGFYLAMDEILESLSAWDLPGSLVGIENKTGVALNFRFYINGEFHNDRVQPFTARIGVYEMDSHPTAPVFTGVFLSTDFAVYEFAGNEKKQIIFEHTVTLAPGQRAAVHIANVDEPIQNQLFFVEKGLFASVTPDNKSLTQDDNVKISECLRADISVLDVFKFMVKAINGRVETDFETKTVTVYPEKRADVFGTVVPGFLLDEAPAVDIEHLIVQGSIQTKPLRPDLKRRTRLEFASSTDADISSLNLPEPAHSRTLYNGPDYPDETEIEQAPLVEPTLEGRPTTLASGAGGRNPLPFLPRMWDNTDGQRSFDIGPRILYAFDQTRQINPDPVNNTDTLTSFFFDTVPNPANTGLVTSFGYATQKRTWELTPTPAKDGSIVFGYAAADLFSTFFLGLTQDQRAGVVIDLLLKMSMSDYVGYNFRSLYTFKYRGIPHRVPMTGIRDGEFCSGTATPTTFFASPAETACCDLPCGCRWTACDYYQDFGPYLRQFTMDVLSLKSFKVDGIELVPTPLGLGLINIVNISGKPFVTNLIDVLNSVAAPYFSFTISTRTHVTKGKRFFNIKRPACIPFEIIISNGGADVFKYTQAMQGTKWFAPGSPYAAFGYGAETYTEPIGCITTTEY